MVTSLFLPSVPQWLLILIFYRLTFSQGCVLRVLCRARLKKHPKSSCHECKWRESSVFYYSLQLQSPTHLSAKFQSRARQVFFSVYDIIYVTFWKEQKYRDRTEAAVARDYEFSEGRPLSLISPLDFISSLSYTVSDHLNFCPTVLFTHNIIRCFTKIMSMFPYKSKTEYLCLAPNTSSEVTACKLKEEVQGLEYIASFPKERLIKRENIHMGMEDLWVS